MEIPVRNIVGRVAEDHGRAEVRRDQIDPLLVIERAFHVVDTATVAESGFPPAEERCRVLRPGESEEPEVVDPGAQDALFRGPQSVAGDRAQEMWRQDDLRRTKEAPELHKRSQHENVRIQIDDRFLPLEEEG